MQILTPQGYLPEVIYTDLNAPLSLDETDQLQELQQQKQQPLPPAIPLNELPQQQLLQQESSSPWSGLTYSLTPVQAVAATLLVIRDSPSAQRLVLNNGTDKFLVHPAASPGDLNKGNNRVPGASGGISGSGDVKGGGAVINDDNAYPKPFLLLVPADRPLPDSLINPPDRKASQDIYAMPFQQYPLSITRKLERLYLPKTYGVTFMYTVQYTIHHIVPIIKLIIFLNEQYCTFQLVLRLLKSDLCFIQIDLQYSIRKKKQPQ
jgi:hypothetical protein